jgi:hypothetical protein
MTWGFAKKRKPRNQSPLMSVRFSKWRAVLTRDHKILPSLSAPRSMPEFGLPHCIPLEGRAMS